MNAIIPTREDIERLQQAMASMPQVALETKHHFADGLYLRELARPAGTTIVGKVHLREHFYIVLQGEVTVVGEGGPVRLKAPCILVSPPGTKRAVYAHVDSICCTVHRTDSRDLEAIERELIEPDEAALFDAYNKLKKERLK
jgi:mannose-6-phosphate isomerase-like protein (cupin superfamily)